MKLPTRLTVGILLALTALVLVLNVRYLCDAPVANAWTWWPGDETWLMSEYKEFLTSGKFVNPDAPGSVYSACSGLVFGSCYITATLYALPTHFVKGNTIVTGRSITFFFSICTLFALWIIAKRYQIRPELRAFGILVLSSSLCFFITSHSARYDMLVGLSLLLIIGYLPLLVESQRPSRFMLMGFIVPCSLLVCGHILLLSFLLLVYAAWLAGIWRRGQTFAKYTLVIFIGLATLLAIQAAVLGSFSITGPFVRDAHLMPFYRFFHPRAQLSNFEWRLFIANLWAPGPMWLAFVLVLGLVWSALRYRLRPQDFSFNAWRLLQFATLLILSSVYVEYAEPRYLMFVLPSIILSFILVTEIVWRKSSRPFRWVFSAALSVTAIIGVWHYQAQARMMGAVGERITIANSAAMDSALSIIHSRTKGRPRIFASIPAEAVAMDDSCTMLTSLIYSFPVDTTVARATLWQRARIGYGIFFNTTDRAVRNGTDSVLSWSRNPPKLIYQSVGTLSDIDRPYDGATLNVLDTLRVYEFQ